MFISHLFVFGEISVQIFCPLFDWIVCFSGSELHELCQFFHLANILSHSDQPRQQIKKQRLYFANKVHLVKDMVFPVVMYGCESWTVKKAGC